MPGDAVLGMNGRIVASTERNMSNLGATLIHFKDGTAFHAGTTDAHAIYRPVPPVAPVTAREHAPVQARTVARGTHWEDELLGTPTDTPAPAISFAGIIADWLTDPVTVGATYNTATGVYQVSALSPAYSRKGA